MAISRASRASSVRRLTAVLQTSLDSPERWDRLRAVVERDSDFAYSALTTVTAPLGAVGKATSTAGTSAMNSASVFR